MGLWAIIKNETVESVAIADYPLDLGMGDTWICIDEFAIKPEAQWTYINGKFEPPSVVLPNWEIKI